MAQEGNDNSTLFAAMDCHHIPLDTVSSTNDYLHGYAPQTLHRITLATAQFQTAGRGATGGWESQPGCNVVFSLLTQPRMVQARRMFVLSQVIALSVYDALSTYATGFSIKWPNDIYHRDRKVVGMLIENDLCGRAVTRCIMGVGVNVNQTTFVSDAPNPGSLALILGHPVDRQQVMQRIMQCFDHYYTLLEQGQEQAIHERYLAHLYRQGEEHEYSDESGRFRATLLTVEPTGHLVLRDSEGSERRYEFKQVKYII